MLLTVLAVAKKPMIVKRQLKAVFLTNLILEFFNFFALELNNLAAENTENMIVMSLSASPFKKLPLPLAY